MCNDYVDEYVKLTIILYPQATKSDSDVTNATKCSR